MNRTPLLKHASSLVPHAPHPLGGLGDRLSDVLSPEPSPPLPAHCLFSPIQYEANYAYPLVVWLHSSRSSELELRQVMPLLSTRNYIGVAPRGTRASSGNGRRFEWEESMSSIVDACDRVRHCVRLAEEEFSVHRDRVFIAGYGAGGTMALRVAMEQPELFRGAISLGGRVPRGFNAFRRLNAARQLAILLSVSPVEGQFSMDDLSEDVRLLHSGGFPFSTQLFPAGDGLTDCMLSYCDSWMMKLACPATVCTNHAV